MMVSATGVEPGYFALYRSGELERRAEALGARLSSCDICPRECGVNRLENELGFCHSARLPIVSAVCAHHGEEPAISGSRGSQLGLPDESYGFMVRGEFKYQARMVVR